MTYIPITPNEMREVARSGRSDALVDALQRGAQTLEDAEREINDLHQALASARADAIPMEVRPLDKPDESTKERISELLAQADPVSLSEPAKEAIVRSVFEAGVMAELVRTEASMRFEKFAEAILADVEDLGNQVHAARGNVAAMANLERDLHAWQGRFSTRVRTLVDQWKLPWAAKVSTVAGLLTAQGARSYIDAEAEAVAEPDHDPTVL